MSYRKNYNSNSRKFNWKRLGRMLALVLASAAVASLIVFAFGGLSFSNPFDKELNPDNLLKYEDYDTKAMIKETGDGLKINWKDDGSIVLTGTNNDNDLEDNEMLPIVFANVTLDPGTYTLSGLEDVKKSELALFVKVGDTKYYADTSTDTFVITEATTVSVGFEVANDKLFVYKTIYPTLVKGETAGDFYA